MEDDLHDHRSSCWGCRGTRAFETYRKISNTFSFQYQSTILLIPTPATVARSSPPINLTGNRQITLAGTTRELRAYLLTLPGPLPAGQQAPSRTLGESRRQGITATTLQRANGHRARGTPGSREPASFCLTGQNTEPAMEVPSEADPASRRRVSAQRSCAAKPEGRGLGARARPRRNVLSARGRGCAGEPAEGRGFLEEGRDLVNAPPPDT